MGQVKSVLYEKALAKEICCDCFTNVLMPPLPCSRGEDSFVQCPDCFETYALWIEEEITIEKVREIFVSRRETNGYHFNGEKDA